MIQTRTIYFEPLPPPHFIIIGVQKGGTNSLYHYLCQHPQIVAATQKEIHFFTLNYDQGLDWYQSQFSPEAEGQQILTGEGSPYYLFHPLVPQRLYESFPETRLIVLLRNPVDRAISHYYWEVTLGYESLSLEEAIAQEAKRLQGETERICSEVNYFSFNHQHYSYLARGLYAEQLQRWMQFFPREQFLILKSEDLYSDSARVVNQVFAFLGLPDYHLSSYDKYNANTYVNANPIIRQKLEAYFLPYNQKLTQLLGGDWSWGISESSCDFQSTLSQSPQNISSTSTLLSVKSMTKVDYESAWDNYAKNWQSTSSEEVYIGDEWIGVAAGAANSLEEYESLIEQKFIAPYIQKHHQVLEIGVGGGRTAALLLNYCDRLVCADISQQLLNATQNRLGNERVSYIKLDGLTLDGIEPHSLDVCFCYDTLVHIEPRDIFNYLTRIPGLLKGDRLCIFHHTNLLSQLGWKKFLQDWDKNLLGKRHGTAFSLMTDSIMEKFLTHLNYEILQKDTESVPRDCVWICKAPEVL
ncbi:sulfotransferase domain-containing protein [Planktothrix mougeotii]|uniref:Sulfotransferase domain-containing protein n=1 Tax=Planktothrix mougeotii LEGE 06226 TaxID=1828728 RepID=A0ABR9UC69_9CYAN|nr:sulfotransferase domain-containing protein [Planktothrix mougeotii]MBE9144027.1 sulfotransferase domain-containing protein [Planktothrix mougeotii LEGE 06226]